MSLSSIVAGTNRTPALPADAGGRRIARLTLPGPPHDLGVVVGSNRAICRVRATTTPRSWGYSLGIRAQSTR